MLGVTRKGNPRVRCRLPECNGARAGERNIYLETQVAEAQTKAMDEPLPTLADRQAAAAKDEQIALAALREKARCGDVAAAKGLLDHSSRLLSEGGEAPPDWLADSPSEATDSR